MGRWRWRWEMDSCWHIIGAATLVLPSFPRTRPVHILLLTRQPPFAQCSGMMDSCLDGCNSCVFAYGQTGAGKTWTMAGKDDKRENWGLARRFIEYLFKEKEDQKAKGQSEIKVSCEYLEIYCEELKDLF